MKKFLEALEHLVLLPVILLGLALIAVFLIVGICFMFVVIPVIILIDFVTLGRFGLYCKLTGEQEGLKDQTK